MAKRQPPKTAMQYVAGALFGSPKSALVTFTILVGILAMVFPTGAVIAFSRLLDVIATVLTPFAGLIALAIVAFGIRVMLKGFK